ncbi:MAG: DNA-binding protein [Thermoprotei archaeon]|nr:MAG: DNA-binding protein [Thermoprotei archaeon]RLF25877.1 MAG: DNA-binding protein [Thermoprotei archaeon]
MSYERYRDWLDEALDDYATAEDLMKLGRYSKVCFFCHQASEKIVKALMIKKIGRYEVLHSVAELLRRLKGYLNVSEDLIRRADMLDRFYIPTRYPNAWPSGAPYRHYTKEDARMALEHAREVIEFAKREIEKDP